MVILERQAQDSADNSGKQDTLGTLGGIVCYHRWPTEQIIVIWQSHPQS